MRSENKREEGRMMRAEFAIGKLGMLGPSPESDIDGER